jgi:hypothetical protein
LTTLDESVFPPLFIEGGKQIGVYIVTTDGNNMLNLAYEDTATDHSDGIVTVQRGAYFRYEFFSFPGQIDFMHGIPFAFTGIIYYKLSANFPSEAPTASPTMKPTLSFAPSISLQPSASPSISVLPSLLPSSSPSAKPTVSTQPSAIPSVSPSANPSVSMAPSSKPSKKPTGNVSAFFQLNSMSSSFHKFINFHFSEANRVSNAQAKLCTNW